MISRFFSMLYAAFAYLVFLASFLYAVGWLGGFLVPRDIDSGVAGPMLEAIIVDVVLLAAFALQHSIMARPAFKRWAARFVPAPIERATFVLAASLLLFAICLGWRPLPAVVWRVQGVAADLLLALFVAGWLVVLSATFMINHFELFGLRQAWLHARGRAYCAPGYVERFFYRIVRHPIMLGFIVAFWATPVMSQGHLLFAVVTTLYILVALQLEERDLLAEHRTAYESYRQRVPMLLPGGKLQRKRYAAASARRA